MIFQEALERIIDDYLNINIIQSNVSSCIITNFDTEESFYISLNDKEDKVIINRMNNGFLDITYKSKEVEIDELESFITNEASFFTGEEITLPHPEELGGENLVLLGVFTQPMAFLEDDDIGESQHIYMGYKLFVESEIDKDRYFLVAHESGGMCPSGWTTATYGEFHIEAPIDEIDMSNATFVPKDKMYLFVSNNSYHTDIFAFIGENPEETKEFSSCLVGIDYEGSDSYYPDGFVATGFTEKEFENAFYFNEDVEKQISSLTPIDLADYYSQKYVYEDLKKSKEKRSIAD